MAQPKVMKVENSVSKAGFKIKNAGVTVDGTISDIQGTVIFDENNLESAKFDISAGVNTIETGIESRDKHLKAADYFDVNKYPRIKFVSSKVEKSSSGYTIKGDLTIKDVTKAVSLPVSYTADALFKNFSTELKINRRDYHVGEASWIMSDDVILQVRISAH
jgi:polyisoprenoid-binding protein YceI